MNRIETRSRHPDDALPGEECPLPYGVGVAPGDAAYVWMRSRGLCECCRRRIAVEVAATRRGLEAVCEVCLSK